MQPLSYFFCLISEVFRPSTIALSLSVTAALLSYDPDQIRFRNHGLGVFDLMSWGHMGRPSNYSIGN